MLYKWMKLKQLLIVRKGLLRYKPHCYTRFMTLKIGHSVGFGLILGAKFLSLFVV